MKKCIYSFSILIFGMTLFQSCMETTHLNVRHAAAISIPSDLDSVVVVNKTKLEKGGGNQVLNVLEGIATGEPILGDKYGAKSSVENMQRLVRESDRMDLIHDQVIDVKLKNISGTTPMKGEFVDSICKEYGADGVIALEHFDSDNDNMGNGSSARVRTQWRVYYPNERKIIDEFQVYSYASDYEYYSIVPPAYKSISRAGAVGAQMYFDRIVPGFRREGRTYYTNGSHEMKAATKSVRRGDWDQAKYYWEVEIESHTSEKIISRAYYNLALVYEIKDDLDKALEYISMSIETGNTKAISYKAILNMRKNEVTLIEEQLKRE